MNTNIFVTYSNTPNCVQYGNKPHDEFLKQPNKFIPIFGGKALYTGNNTFLNNIIGDDTGNHVSVLNPYINQHSVIYWVGNNLQNIKGDYIGFCHYRRLFDIPDNETIDQDTIYINKMEFTVSNSVYFLLNHDPNTVRTFSEFIQKYIRTNKIDNVNGFIEFLNSNIFFSGNMFIMHKTQFAEYMNLMAPIYNILYNMIFPFPNTADRAVSFILERMTTFVILQMQKNNPNIKIKQGKYVKLGDLAT